MLINHPFDILAINETKLDSTISDSEIYINEYIVIRKDRNRNGGESPFLSKILYLILKGTI